MRLEREWQRSDIIVKYLTIMDEDQRLPEGRFGLYILGVPTGLAASDMPYGINPRDGSGSSVPCCTIIATIGY
jgi:hypothetical protein